MSDFEDRSEMTCESLAQTIRADDFKGIAVLPSGVAALIATLARTMRNQKAPAHDVALMQKSVCEQFGIVLPDFFVRDKADGAISFCGAREETESIIQKILENTLPRKWMRIFEIKRMYPRLSKFPDMEIGRACMVLGVPKKNPKNVKYYFFPCAEMREVSK